VVRRAGRVHEDRREAGVVRV